MTFSTVPLFAFSLLLLYHICINKTVLYSFVSLKQRVTSRFVCCSMVQERMDDETATWLLSSTPDVAQELSGHFTSHSFVRHALT